MENLKNPLSIPRIRSNCNFWMMRTNSGAFYNEFVREGFLAIGWNAIYRATLSQYKDDGLISIISKHYPKEKQPRSPVNKCVKFIDVLSDGDIALIVGDGVITFAMIKEYYEVSNDTTTIQNEIVVDELISKGLHKEEPIKCPYIKRRKIEIICTKQIFSLNPNLYKAYILNRHSLSNLNDYAEYILSACYDIYVYRNLATITFRANSVDRLKALDVSGFIYHATRLLCFEDEELITTKIYLSSPGDILFQIENGIIFIESHWEFFVALALILFGGNMELASFKIPIPSLKNMITEFCNRKRKKELMDLEMQEKRETVRGIKLDNDKKEFELEKARELELEKIIESITESARNIRIAAIDNKIIPYQTIVVQHDDKESPDNA